MITTDRETLHQKSREITPEEAKSLRIFERMDENGRNGVGLAAIQIGEPVRAIIIRYRVRDRKTGELFKFYQNMINPVITDRRGAMVTHEGCLSLPGITLKVRRSMEITVKWLNENGIERTETFKEAQAIICQHEIDHCDGILISDKPAEDREKIGRNQPCPCGSGKKFKKCCGR
jgi:peptide deformylase